MSDRKPNLANHILPTSANLLGICFLIFSLAHFMNRAEATILDECSAAAIFIFLISSFCSYVSLRSDKFQRLEKVADVTFMLGLVILAAVAAFIAIKVAV